MIRLALILLCLLRFGVPTWSFAQNTVPQNTVPQNTAAPAISSDQARAALDVLNDPAKRAAFTATLNAIVKAQPHAAATTLAPPSPPAADVAPASPAPTETTVQGLTIPLAPDSLGAQVLLSASAFV